MITRFVSATPAAALVTGGLFLGMIGLIYADFVPRDVSENTEFEIAPVVEDIETLSRRTEIEPLAQVDTPPPPPRIDVQTADEPSVPIVKVYGGKPDFDPVTIKPSEVTLVIPDGDVQPIFRTTHVMPANATRSGRCDMRFDVSPDGEPFNISATCTQRIFERPSRRSVEGWKYKPRILEGQAVVRTGVRTRLTYDLTDERGVRIPE